MRTIINNIESKMKNLMLIIGFLFINKVNSQDLGFTNITISPLSANSINVNVKAVTNCGSYLSYTYSIQDSTINLDICYFFCSAAVILNLENDFAIDIPSMGNYNLNVIAHMSSDPITCEYFNIQDIALLSFTIPLNEIVTLSTKTITIPINDFLFPNPTTGILKQNNVGIYTYTIYDCLGRRMKQYKNLTNEIDLSEFADGTYFIELKNSERRILKKVILKK